MNFAWIVLYIFFSLATALFVSGLERDLPLKRHSDPALAFCLSLFLAPICIFLGINYVSEGYVWRIPWESRIRG